MFGLELYQTIPNNIYILQPFLYLKEIVDTKHRDDNNIDLGSK